MKKHVIVDVIQGSIAEELDIAKGDYLISINDKAIEDALDYHLMAEEDALDILIEKQGTGEQWLLEIDKDPEETLGLVFESDLMDCYKSCNNKCIFCFIDQLPKGMRPTLYFKDDDARLSFLQGNYITMTNMKEADIERIIRYHLTPINISIHTLDLELRKKMLNNRFADRITGYMDQLFEKGITMNGQIVLCKGVNDGAALKATLEGIERYLPVMQSLSIVPVGLSDHREGLYPLEPFTKEDAKDLITLVHAFQERYLKDYNLHAIHLSDEFYLLAEMSFPDEATYDDYLQLENGVGMSRLLIDEFAQALETSALQNLQKRKLTIVTGTLFAETLTSLMDQLMIKHPEITVQVIPVVNDFFGHRITISGLLTGRDMIQQLKGQFLGETVLIPDNTLKSGEPIFLDDVTVADLQTALGVPVITVPSSGYALYQHVTTRKESSEA